MLKILETKPSLRFPYFFTLCAIILDIICGINYMPFNGKKKDLIEIVANLRRVGRDTGNTDHSRRKVNHIKIMKKKEYTKQLEIFLASHRQRPSSSTENLRIRTIESRQHSTLPPAKLGRPFVDESDSSLLYASGSREPSSLKRHQHITHEDASGDEKRNKTGEEEEIYLKKKKNILCAIFFNHVLTKKLPIKEWRRYLCHFPDNDTEFIIRVENIQKENKKNS